MTDLSCLGVAFVSSVISAVAAGALTLKFGRHVVNERVRRQIFNEAEMVIQHRRKQDGQG